MAKEGTVCRDKQRQQGLSGKGIKKGKKKQTCQGKALHRWFVSGGCKKGHYSLKKCRDVKLADGSGAAESRRAGANGCERVRRW